MFEEIKNTVEKDVKEMKEIANLSKFLKEHAVKPKSNHMKYLNDCEIYDYVWDDYIELGKKVKKNEDNYSIMTVIAGTNGIYVVEGYHYVNRIGYIITDKPYKKIFNNDIRIIQGKGK